MWAIPFVEGKNQFIYIKFAKPQIIGGLKIWNYNSAGTDEEVYPGIKQISVEADGKLLTSKKGVTLRRGPCNVLYDYFQIIDLPY